MEILKTIFNMSVTGSIIFLIFLILKPLTKKYFNSSWHYRMLVLILIFFIIPVGSFIKIPAKSMFNIPAVKIQEFRDSNNIIKNEGTKLVQKSEDIEGRKSEKEIGAKTESENPNITENKSHVFDKTNYNIDSYTDIFQYIWIGGMLALFLLKIVPYIKFRVAILKNSTGIKDEDILELFDLCKNELNINNKISLRTCDAIGSPMLMGVFRPIVLIPNIGSNAEKLKMVFLHELNHYKRKDISIKIFGFIVNMIHWFNPMVYILLNRMDRYCEYSIDERVVDKMGIEDRKHYGEIILNLIDNSMMKKSYLTTAMGAGGKELKSRLENMLFSFKTTRKRYAVSLLVSILIIVSGLTVACSVVPGNVSGGNEPFVVYLKEDGLYYSHLGTGEEIKIHDGDSFEYPLVSKSGNYIAYTQNGSLYIYDIENGEYEKIADEINHYYIAYDWIDDENIIYATKNSGFATFNILTGETKEHSDEHYYDSFKASDKNIIYGRRESRWSTEEGDFAASDGIVRIDLNEYDPENKTFLTDMIIEARKFTDEMIGTNPIVWNITGDGRYVYIMEKPASGSLSSDMVGIGIYDVEEKTHTELTDISTLSYKNHLAINPSNNNLIGLIEGAGREIIVNKEVILLNINEDKTYEAVNFMDKDLVAMTPSFTPDGEKLLYSATKSLEGISIINLNDIYGNIYADVYDVWENQPHNIYEYDLKTSEVKKVTDGEYFDFMPMSISRDEILFIRYKGNDHYSLIKLVNGEENIIVDDIIFSGGSDNYVFGYYGHIHTEKGMDVFLNK